MSGILKTILIMTALVTGLYGTYVMLSNIENGNTYYYGGQPKEFNDAQKKAFQF